MERLETGAPATRALEPEGAGVAAARRASSTAARCRFSAAVRLGFFTAAGLAFAATAYAQSGTEPRFRALFDGTLNGWTKENGVSASVADGVLRVEAPRGWLRADGRYADFVLRVEFRFVDDDTDSGLFVRAAADGEFVAGWPNDSYQIQLRNPIGESRFPPVGGVFRHGRPDGPTRSDPADAERLSIGTGAWQTMEVDVRGESLSVTLNGEPLTEALEITNPSGYIGIQGERGAIEFRMIEIAERP